VPGEDVEDHVGGMDTLAEGLDTGGLDVLEPVTQHGGQDLDHLPVAVSGAG
jgi:hypothetical protein